MGGEQSCHVRSENNADSVISGCDMGVDMRLALSHLLRVAFLLASSTPLHGLNAEFFRSPDILEDKRHPPAAVLGNGEFITVGHFRGTLRQGKRRLCNGVTCFSKPNQVFRSVGWADVFISKYNSSNVLQWTRVGGGAGDDRARAVNTDHEGDVLVAGYITGVNAKFGGLELSSRTALTRTIFIAKYSPSGAIKFIREFAACVTPTCDVTSLSQDASGIVLMGNYHATTSFGIQRKCTREGECLDTDKGHLRYTDPGTLKSTGSGMKFVNRCWVTKLDTRGEHLWHQDCGDGRHRFGRGLTSTGTVWWNGLHQEAGRRTKLIKRWRQHNVIRSCVPTPDFPRSSSTSSELP